MQNEETLLRTSIAATTVFSGVGVAVGVIAGSSSILFDGIYGTIDAFMTLVALWVVRLIHASNAADAQGRNLSRRFTFGFWHLEPMVLGLNGILLMGAALYALLDSIRVILAGGRMLSFDTAMAYAGVSTVLDLAMAAYVARANRTIRSQLVALDAKSWVMTAALGAALFLAFGIGALAQGTRYEWISPYIDPAVLAAICLVIAPLPFPTVRKAFSEILLMTPPALKDDIDRVAAGIVASHGFVSHNAFVARAGRGIQVELNFIVPKDQPPKRLEEWDALRDTIGEAFGNDGPDLWLTIVFTTEPRWAW